MRRLIAVILVAIAACTTHAMAATNPFELKSDRFNRGMVIIALDDATTGSYKTEDGFSMDVLWYDPVAKKPHIQLDWFTFVHPDIAYFTLVRDGDGRGYLIGSMGQGEAVIASYWYMEKWGMCYNAGTYHFFVKGGAYNFIGRFNDQPSFETLNNAVAAGQLPSSIPVDGSGGLLFDQTLTGFTPAEDRPGDKDRLATFLATKIGHPVDIVTPKLSRTSYNLSTYKSGKRDCAIWLQNGDRPDRPDRSKPAPTEAPAADSAAQPAAGAVVNWIPRPQVP